MHAGHTHDRKGATSQGVTNDTDPVGQPVLFSRERCLWTPTVSEILQSFKKDWWRWTPGERLSALLGLALTLALVLGLGYAGLIG